MSFSSYHFRFLLKTSLVYLLLLNNLFNPKVLCMSCPVIILCSRSFFKLDCTESRKEIQCFTPHVFIKTKSEIWFLSKMVFRFQNCSDLIVLVIENIFLRSLEQFIQSCVKKGTLTKSTNHNFQESWLKKAKKQKFSWKIIKLLTNIFISYTNTDSF